jgi:hypothetical protein
MQLVERNFSSAQVAAAAVCPWGNLSFGYQTIIFREFPIFYAFHHWILIRLFLKETRFYIFLSRQKFLFALLIFFKG